MGESADPTWARPLVRARFAAFWSSVDSAVTAGLPPSVQAFDNAGISDSSVVPFSTAMVRPHTLRSGPVTFFGLPFGTNRFSPALKYVTKSTVASRFFVSVNDDMPMLYLSAASAGMIASNVTFWKLALRPSFAAMALPRSTSRPMMVLPSVSKYSFGAYDASLAMVRVPADLIAAGTSADSFPPAAAGVDFLLEQPLTMRAAAIASTPAAWVRVRRRSGVTIPPGTGQSRPVMAGLRVAPAWWLTVLGASCQHETFPMTGPSVKIRIRKPAHPA